ncbi:CRISPR-associated endonuclease Cas3'' [Candidatus Bathyarchaeota archaeon]|nr:CRISPR-associated endonuclease Cas3'' [Candidatus Bathyarchaeota archaeon]
MKLDLRMSYSYKLRSHPNKLLISHLKEVAELSEKIVSSKHLADKEVIARVAYLIGATHDFAKATTFFQDLLIRDERTHYAVHGSLSSLLTYQVVKGYLSDIGKLNEFKWLPTLAWVAVKRHHGNMRNFVGEEHAETTVLRDPEEKLLITKQIQNILEENKTEIYKILSELLEGVSVQGFMGEIQRWDPLVKEIRVVVRDLCRDQKMDNYLMMLFLYSVLLDADKMSAAEMNLPPRISSLRSDVVDEYLNKTFSAKQSGIGFIREQAYADVVKSLSTMNLQEERLLSINLPTGMGKTLAGFSFSLKLRERVAKEFGFEPRIIYCLPFLSIIDQNSDVIEKVLRTQFSSIPSNLLLKHHHLADIRYVEEREEELHVVEDANKAMLLMEAWDSEIVVTTFVQFFHSLITNRNRAARKFHNIVNSIIILDEGQAIPSKYWLLMNEVLRLLSWKFSCWIILMTATQPLIFEPITDVKELVFDKTRYFNSFDRVEFHLDLDGSGNCIPRDFEDFKKDILKEVQDTEKSLMIVLNTISSCKELYEFLKNQLLSQKEIDSEDLIDEDGICNINGLHLINLSTHILPASRLRRINRIRQGAGRKVIVTTQLVEAGVDISVDTVYRDMAPLDCIIQTAGRCKRNNDPKKGTVNVVLLRSGNGRLFHSFVYDPILLSATKRVLGEFENRVSEKDFVPKAIAKYYEMVKENGRKQPSKEIIEYLKRLDLRDTLKFKLIEEGDETISIFIESGANEERLRKEIEAVLKDTNRFARKTRLNSLRKSINENTVSVRYSRRLDSIKSLPALIDESFRYVPRDNLSEWYRKDTGFQSY